MRETSHPFRLKAGVLAMASSKPKDMILAALAAGPEVWFTPVQVQKLLFLIDRRIPKLVGGPIFNFVPYHYGPFDKRIYPVLKQLEEEGLVKIQSDSNFRRDAYALTENGVKKGWNELNALPSDAADFIKRANAFVLKATFAQLISAIYRAYPDMKVNSVFAKQ